MTVDVSSDHVFISVLTTIHRKIITSLVFNMMKSIKFLFKLIFSLFCFAMATPLSIAWYLIILLLVDSYADLPNAISLKGCKLLIVTVSSSTHNLLLLPSTSSFVNVLLLLLMLNVTADAYLLRDFRQLQQT